MDNARRYHLRDRVTANGSKDLGKVDNLSEDAETASRQKFQKTAVDQEPVFRKPTLPASVLRHGKPDPPIGLGQPRKSTVRDAVRVPSGPREFPNSVKRYGGTGSSDDTIGDTTSSSVQLSSDHEGSNRHIFGDRRERVGTGKQHSRPSTDYGNTLGQSLDRSDEDFTFIPAVNFDDFQDSMAKYGGSNPLLNEFPGVPGPRLSTKNDSNGQRLGSYASTRQSVARANVNTDPTIDGSQPFSRRLSTHHTARQSSLSSIAAPLPSSFSQPNMMPLRSRRQSSVPQAPIPLMDTPVQKAPRKSLGPGVVGSMIETRKSSLPTPNAPMDASARGSMVRTGSINRARKPISSGVALNTEAFRQSTATASTVSRLNKSKLTQGVPIDDDGTPATSRASRSHPHRTHTPSSSGHKRQSTVSGRASGLGARTISPTDARRLKRLSMMQPPPVPTAHLPVMPHQQEEMSTSQFHPDSSHLTSSSPSLIPRVSSNATPTSARVSPESRPLNGTLSTKSSHQNLSASAGSSSRLPTLKTRSSTSSAAQYGEDDEIVPPVPAIPKAFESPRDEEFPSIAHDSSVLDFDVNGMLAKTIPPEVVLASSKPSSAFGISSTYAFDSTSASRLGRSETASTLIRTQPDLSGRRNNNLQPLRLPPLNFGPIDTSRMGRSGHRPRVSDDWKHGDSALQAQTPEPRRPSKTPSTPMTASKATFFRRHDDGSVDDKIVRSSSSHWALRDIMDPSDGGSRFFDDSDLEAIGLNPPTSTSTAQLRPVITPFTSGSLPKYSGEFTRPAKISEYPTLDSHSEVFDPSDGGTGTLSSGLDGKSFAASTETSSSGTVPHANAELLSETIDHKDKKESTTQASLRRRLSMSWKRSSSKASTHQEKGASLQEAETTLSKNNNFSKRTSEMPPPRLPASISAQWSSTLPHSSTESSLPTIQSQPRPSLDSTTRRKSTFVSQGNGSSTTLTSDGGDPQVAVLGHLTMPKTRAVQADATLQGSRSSSWGVFSQQANARSQLLSRPDARVKAAPPTISANVKDKDDAVADEEMRRLSQKRKDVDSAARDSEQLRARATAKTPMTPEHALHDRGLNLNIFERGEILDYEKDCVYFTGTRSAKKIIGSVGATSTSLNSDKSGNHGYDDERGDYNIVLGDHLAYRYEVVDVLGKGSFGQVVRCVDHQLGGVVAIKIIRNKKRFHQQALVEVGILGRLREWDPDGSNATLSMTSSFYFRSHLCIVTPCLSINLYELIKAHNFSGFSIPLIRRFARQLLSCLVLLQQKRIIHCDLKPENILLCDARKADIRVIDFGSSCREEEKVYTYIQSRFYRSPEVILGSSYGLGIDMWSFGCILAELWTGYPIFPGENEQEQLACIMEIFGPPDKHLVERCTRKKLFFDSVGKPRITVSSKGRRRRPSSKTLAQALKTDDDAFLDFIARCLRWDPERRLKPAEAVRHPFIMNQPMSQRPGIPSEARRVPRVKPTNGSGPGSLASSPTKRAPAIGQPPNATPAREKTRGISEAPLTVMRASTLTAAPTLSSFSIAPAPSSPAKLLGSSGVHRRHSTVASAGSAAAIAGSKRASNGTVLSSGVSGASLAHLAAKESMAVAGSQAAVPAKWRA